MMAVIDEMFLHPEFAFFTFPYTLENWKDYIKIGKDSILEIHYDLVPLILPHLF